MIYWLMNLFSRSDLLDTTNRQDYINSTMPDVNDKKIVEDSVLPQSPSELEILVNEFGELRKGQAIEISLSRILELLPRNRHKADAYKGLRSALMKQYGVSLLITSSKQKKHEKTKI